MAQNTTKKKVKKKGRKIMSASERQMAAIKKEAGSALKNVKIKKKKSKKKGRK